MGGPCRCCLRQEMRSIERWNGRSWKVEKLKSWRVKGFLDSLLTLQLWDYRDRPLNLSGKGLYDCGELHIGGGVGGNRVGGHNHLPGFPSLPFLPGLPTLEAWPPTCLVYREAL